MAKNKPTLKKFEAVALPREQAQQIKGGYRDMSQFPFVQPAPSFVGWGEIEIRSNGFSVTAFEGIGLMPTPPPPSGRGR